MSKLEKVTRINVLLDFYGQLLTPKQLEIMNYHYLEDYSLFEISEILQISRSAISDSCKRSVQSLELYEAKLKMFAKSQQRNEIYDKILQLGNDEVVSLVNELKEI